MNPYISSFELVKIIGIRAQQISRGNPPRVKIDNLPEEILYDAEQLALYEFNQGKCPLVIKRVFPDGHVEYIKCSKVLVNNDLFKSIFK